ncbi:uncharacterized protein LOC126747397 [Anthonomus grandis grandis]|uniref:uncharacterized protein LOC126747397 n=1 Tax=Anthonomus grandis grandis TaxID=2921223 RepID=UPI0021668887|nr:uncharacterized protein LOC126747397 [Anthonomus grandis grandis]
MMDQDTQNTKEGGQGQPLPAMAGPKGTAVEKSTAGRRRNRRLKAKEGPAGRKRPSGAQRRKAKLLAAKERGGTGPKEALTPTQTKANTSETQKRHRSEGETPQESKRPRKKPRGPRREPGLSYRDAAAQQQANTLKGWLLNKTLALQSGSQIAPKFAGVSQGGGILHITCVDESTKNWLVELVQKETPWEGAELQITEDGKLPRPVKAITWVPGPTEEPKALLHKLDVQNNINTSLWKVLDMRKDQDDKGCLVTLLMDEKSWAKVRGANQSLYLNFGSIKIRLSASSQEKEKRDQATPMEIEGLPGTSSS